MLILPYLGPKGAAIYNQLDLTLPWDAPANSMYHAMIPPQFQCPMDRPFTAGDTSYCVISSPGCAFDGVNHITLHDIHDPQQHDLGGRVSH